MIVVLCCFLFYLQNSNLPTHSLSSTVINFHHLYLLQLPVNLKFVFECMEESGSEGLDALLLEHLKPEGFFKTVDYVCISDNYWLGTTKPCLTYGLRGISYYFVEVECATMDLHSGVYGGTVHEGNQFTNSYIFVYTNSFERFSVL